MFKKIVIVGALSFFGYAILKRFYLTEMGDADSGPNSDSTRNTYEIEYDE